MNTDEKDPLDDPHVKAMLKEFRKEVIPNIKGSVMTAAIIAGSMPDAKQCLEIGASVLMGKPIMVICIDRAQVPRHLAKIATIIVEVDDLKSKAGQEKVREAIDSVVRGMA